MMRWIPSIVFAIDCMVLPDHIGTFLPHLLQISFRRYLALSDGISQRAPGKSHHRPLRDILDAPGLLALQNGESFHIFWENITM